MGKNRRLWVAMVLLLTAGAAWAMGSRGEDPPDSNSERTTVQLIAAAVESGAIDPDTAVEYRVYAVVDAEKLPAQYHGGRPMKDGTSILRQARARYPELRPEVQQRLRPYLYPRGNR